MEVLVIDDEIVLRETVAHTLRESGYQVTTACSGHEALEILKNGRQQLVISDWNMVGMSGLELCRIIRNTDFHRYIYFILLTSNNNKQDTLAGLNSGADDYITKPFHPQELILRVNTGRRIVRVESRDIVIFTLAKLAESRDPETGLHLDRVRRYCQALARHLQHAPDFRETINDEFVRLVYETSPLHDIGKVAIPDSILLKPGRLTEHEFEVMKTHTTHAATTLAAAIEEFPHADFLQMARDIAISHHERFDGSGYPRGLAGHDIPLCGRIVALADVYDALTSKRVYKEAMSHEDAKLIIEKERGRHFDPAIVDAFGNIADQFLTIRNQFSEDSQ